jgi:hypothetical protein
VVQVSGSPPLCSSFSQPERWLVVNINGHELNQSKVMSYRAVLRLRRI